MILGWAKITCGSSETGEKEVNMDDDDDDEWWHEWCLDLVICVFW